MADNAFEHPRLAAVYDPLDPDRCDLDGYASMRVELATTTGDVAQAIVAPEDWSGTLGGIHDALCPGGHLVFETRDPAYLAWQTWTKQATYGVTEVDGIGTVESWLDLTEVRWPLVSFRGTYVP